MVDAVIRWSLRNRIFVFAGAALLLFWGSYEAYRIPLNIFPDLSAPTVTVVAEAHGMAPEEVEALITFPIETALNGASGIRRVRSSTTVGVAVIWVEFEWGTDIFRARQIVSEKLQLASASLPAELPAPVLAPISSVMGQIMFVALSSSRHDPMKLREVADWTLRRRLLAVPGVSQVVPIGGDTRQYQVLLRPERLSAYGLSVSEVIAALDATNENASAGFLLSGGQELLIHGLGRVHSAADIGQTVVTTRDGVPVTVADLALVQIGPALKRGDGALNGRPAVIMGIQKQPGTNTLELTRRLDQALDALGPALPEGMEVRRDIFRQSDFIEVAVDNVTAALRDGALLVVLIVLVFLASGRATAITVLAIPLSLLAAILGIKALGSSVNTMTLGGMAIAVGALVDDAIIDVENVVRRLRENLALPEAARRSVFEVVFEASREIRTSIVFATLIIVLAFLPLFFLSGVEGRLLAPLGFAYVVSLGASLVVALTVTPALCAWLLPRSRTVAVPKEPKVVTWLKARYAPLLDAALGRWRVLSLVALLALVAATVGLFGAGRAFLPDFNEGALTISVVAAPGTDLETSGRLAALAEEQLLAQPEVVAIARRTGRAEQDEHAQGVNASELEVSLRPGERSKEALLAALRRGFASIPGAAIVIGQPISHRIDHMLSGTRASIAVKIFGPELATLRKLGAQVRDAMSGVEGVADLSLEQQADIPLVTLRLRRAALAQHGLRAAEVVEASEVAFGGHAVSRVLEGQASFDLIVRYEEGARADLEAIRQTLVITPSGAQVPLHALAEVRQNRGPNAISREGVQRKIVVSSNVSGRDVHSVVQDIQARVQAQVTFPDGYHVAYGGQFESAAEATRALVILGSAAILGIFLLLYVAFGQLRDAALVMLNLPLALIGGVVGVYASGGVLSVASIIGFITLFGVATRNGIMMISHMHHLVEEEGVRSPLEAVRRGAIERLAPILMTAIASGLGLLPLALAGGEAGSEIQTPMAIVILYGLVSATALNMLLIPALYLRFGSLEGRVAAAQG